MEKGGVISRDNNEENAQLLSFLPADATNFDSGICLVKCLTSANSVHTYFIASR